MSRANEPDLSNGNGGHPGSGQASRPWHTLSGRDVARILRTDPENGLSEAGAAERLRQYGPNALAETPGRSPLAILLEQFRSLIVGLLVAATVVAFAMNEQIEGVAILVVILLNAAIGFATEWKAERALTALRRQTVSKAHIIRGGEEAEVPASRLVPGDVVVLDAGARVPADGVLVETVQLEIEEASLTGESQPVSKSPDPVPDEDVPLGDRTNMAYMGTTVTSGRGRIIVTSTGMRTEVGRIGELIEETSARETPLELRLAQLGRALVGVVLVLCAVIVTVGWLRGVADLGHLLEVGISLAIAAVPEGLPAVATMTLAIGMQRMARMRALVRQLPAVETLGSTTVICTDKTGTLTRNEMTVRAFQLGDRQVEVTGVGYSPAGEFRLDDRAIGPKADEHLILALRIGALCNDAEIDRDGDAVTVLGDPTEAALLVAAEKAGLDLDTRERDYPRLAELPFSSETRRMVTVHRTPDERTVAYVKGAPGVILEASESQLTASGSRPLGPREREHCTRLNEELAGRALRILALAYREVPEEYEEKDLTGGYVFVGLVGMIDPLREEAKEAVTTCRKAGIRVVMITGDQAATAAEIGRQLGIDRDPRGRALRAVHGRELAGLDDEGWRQVTAEAGVFARVSPEHKLRIVEALQADGEVVAMTGDGVNDAPALKRADIGVAMGIKGTEVAREAADMVILDDHFATIVAAVEQGRIIYANIVRFIHYLFSCNLSEILVVFLAILFGWPLPLAALQVLWLNMITDVFPALALALEPSSPDAMQKPPRDPDEPLVPWPFVGLIAWQGLLLTAVTLGAFALGMEWYGSAGTGLRRAVTVAFMTLALTQVFHVFNARSQRRSAFDRLFTNAWLWAAVLTCVLLQLAAVNWPFLQGILHTAPLALIDWAVVLAFSLAPVVVVELVKFTQSLASKRKG
jgi:P-type Ca2+ transporter type 2C